MPDLPIIDAHVHLWGPGALWHGLARRQRPARPALFARNQYRAHTAGLAIEALVYLQVDVAPAYGLLEAQFVAGLAAHDPRIGADCGLGTARRR